MLGMRDTIGWGPSTQHARMLTVPSILTYVIMTLIRLLQHTHLILSTSSTLFSHLDRYLIMDIVRSVFNESTEQAS
jgi:hypothetical protein